MQEGDEDNENVQISYWKNRQNMAPGRMNAAVLGLSEDRRLEGDIGSPDSTREMVIAKGGPIMQTKRAAVPPKKKREEPAPEEETSVATASEGHLSNEEAEVSETSKGSVPEAEENLLKD